MGFIEKDLLTSFLPKLKELRTREAVVRVVRFTYYRNFATAEEELERALRKPLLEYNFYGRGIYMALRGLIEAARAKDTASYAQKLLEQLGPETRPDPEKVHESLSRAFDEYDLGFMETWKLIRYVVEDLKARAPPPAPEE